MLVTANISDVVNKKLEGLKKQTGMSKSKLIEKALTAYVNVSTASARRGSKEARRREYCPDGK